MYYEDFDLCRRARAEKQQTLYVPDAVVMHIGGHSLPTDIVRIHGMSGPLGLVAQYRYIEKYAGRQAARCLRCAYMLAGMSLCSLASLWPDPTQRRQALRYGRLLAQTSLPRTFSMREGKEHHAQ
jgi:hypothetical protein